MRDSLIGGLIAGAVAATAAAVEPPATQPGSTTQPAAAAPMDVEGSLDSNWSYLKGKYDGDGDGVISKAEYDRTGGQFERLDRNSDGRISEADFQQQGRGGGRMMERMRAQRLVSTYFQDDAKHDRLSLEELERSVVAFDSDGDGAVGQSEFKALAEQRKVQVPGSDSPMVQRRMRDVVPWDGLVAGVDGDEDGALTRAEFVEFFTALDDGDRVWVIRAPARRQRQARGEGRGEGGGEPESGPKVGQMAPDFTLSSPDGTLTATLSSFSGNLPVALIFGSYT